MRARAEALVDQYVKSDAIRRHLYAVEEAMGHYARLYGEDEAYWRLTGLLHDFDYEAFPEEHPTRGMEMLLEAGFDQELVDAVGGHAAYTGIPRVTKMARTLFAVDELAGFVMAVARVRPSGMLADVTVKSVRKKLKDKAFARQVNREEIIQGAAELGVELPQHIQNVIDALAAAHERLGFPG